MSNRPSIYAISQECLGNTKKSESKMQQHNKNINKKCYIIKEQLVLF